MSKTQIINFRVKDSELDAIDKRAELEGLSRSDFIRSAINLALRQDTVSLSEREIKQEIQAPVQTGPRCPHGGPRGCPSAVFVKILGGKRQCQVCGVKTN